MPFHLRIPIPTIAMCLVLSSCSSSTEAHRTFSIGVTGTATTTAGLPVTNAVVTITPVNLDGTQTIHAGKCVGYAAFPTTTTTDAAGLFQARIDGGGPDYRLCLAVEVKSSTGASGVSTKDGLHWSDSETFDFQVVVPSS